jgi:16S rRNA (cytidine1402-2'-O)-methyltransferase
METPFRNNQLLADALAFLSPQTKLCIAKNLTAADELIQTKTIADWKNHPLDLHNVPTVFILQAF